MASVSSEGSFQGIEVRFALRRVKVSEEGFIKMMSVQLAVKDELEMPSGWEKHIPAEGTAHAKPC